MTITTLRAADPSSTPPSAEAIELAIENASIDDLMMCASADLDVRVVDWKRFADFDAAVESDTYAAADGIATLVFGLTLNARSGPPVITTVTVSAGLLGDAVVLLGVDTLFAPAPAPLMITADDAIGLPAWPTPLPNVLARSLHEILAICQEPTLAAPGMQIETIRKIAARTLPFDHARMRLRIDDQHGNRSFIQLLAGRWKAFRNDGREVRFTYCFGHPSDEAQIGCDLSAATTIHDIQRAAMSHVRGLQEVQVEVVWDRHLWDGECFRHVPL